MAKSKKRNGRSEIEIISIEIMKSGGVIEMAKIMAMAESMAYQWNLYQWQRCKR
jgi:L-alanine-DL-glutamate epimerase-like enolase superfamily enzyme